MFIIASFWELLTLAKWSWGKAESESQSQSQGPTCGEGKGPIYSLCFLRLIALLDSVIILFLSKTSRSLELFKTWQREAEEKPADKAKVKGKKPAAKAKVKGKKKARAGDKEWESALACHAWLLVLPTSCVESKYLHFKGAGKQAAERRQSSR